MNNTAQDISLSGVCTIHDVTSERGIAVIVSCMISHTVCWFVFKSVGYRTTLEHEIVCFATQISFRYITNA
jgi:hypothetical protein